MRVFVKIEIIKKTTLLIIHTPTEKKQMLSFQLFPFEKTAVKFRLACEFVTCQLIGSG
jgi:hypothetical protein